MKTERELLEAAAKAAGIKYDPDASKPHPKSGAFWGLWLTFDREPHEYDRRYWNPLTDDGDALRLAVKLGLDLCVSPNYRLCAWNSVASDWVEEPPGNDPCAAMRLCIVRAAAAMAG